MALNVVQLGLEVPICHSSLKDVEDQVYDKPQHPIDSTTINLAWFSRCHCMQTAVREIEVINNSFYIRQFESRSATREHETTDVALTSKVMNG